MIECMSEYRSRVVVQSCGDVKYSRDAFTERTETSSGFPEVTDTTSRGTQRVRETFILQFFIASTSVAMLAELIAGR